MRSSIPLAIELAGLLLFAGCALQAQGLPVRGLHLGAPKPDEIPLAVRFIREALPKEGVNVLVVEVNYRYQYTRHPEVVDADALSGDDVKKLVEACRSVGIKLIPQINLLGHQSWDKTTFGLLRAHPEFDETPGKYPENEGIYCRSYCPLHPEVHKIVFDLVDELADAFGADAFHIGMDEIFLLGEDDCPRCKGKNKAELLTREVRAIHDHLADSKRTLWMWGDRFLDGEVTGIGKWEASINGTAPAIQSVPKDIVICDWHYETAHPTASHFALMGFPVVSAPWRQTSVALRQLDLIRQTRMNASPEVSARMLGVLQTTWCDFGQFARGYFEEGAPEASTLEAVHSFRELFADLRKQP